MRSIVLSSMVVVSNYCTYGYVILCTIHSLGSVLLCCTVSYNRTTNMASFYYKKSTSTDKLRDLGNQHQHGSTHSSSHHNQGYQGYQGW